ncbi:MAG: B12-binding domain-containing radical SAM protein [Candidatus Scalindua sp.]
MLVFKVCTRIHVHNINLSRLIVSKMYPQKAQPQEYPYPQQPGQSKKVMLIFPPDWYPSEPYLSLPTLTAFLRKAGHCVIQKDMNLEMYDWFFSEEGLNLILERTPHKHAHFNITKLTEKAESAKIIVRSQEFYNVDKLEWAMNVFREVTDTISLAYAPAKICMPPMETDLKYKLFMSSEILEAVEDIQVNVYRDVFNHILKPAIEAEEPDVIGISIVLKQQLFSSITFCAMIKEQFPGIHITIGGNTVTRLRDVLPQAHNMFSLFDTAIMYEGETAFLQLVNAIGTDRDFSTIPNLIFKDSTGIHTSTITSAEDMSTLPPPDFDGLSLEKYFVPDRILPYLSTRGCYWGRCEFCDHGEGYTAGYRAKNIDQIIEEIRYLRDKHRVAHFHFPDESYPPALFKKLTRKLIEADLQIAWSTHLRFEESLLDDKVWEDAEKSGCKFLHMGFESGSERVLKLMGKATTTEVIQRSLEASSRHGVWNHVMGFFGFPGETFEDAKITVRFLEDNKEHVHSIGFGTFDLSKYSPVLKNAKKFGVTYNKNPEWDLALDYYFTVKEGLGIEDAERVLAEFERSHYEGWNLRIYIREYVFLYVAHYGTNKLPLLQFKPQQK